MKVKFKNSTHRKTFSTFVSEKIKSPFCSRNEFVAAVFLLSADEFLWKRSRRAMTGYSINFNSLDLTGISTEGYALFMAAKAVYCGGADISLNELCDVNLIDNSTVTTIFMGVLLSRNGFAMLNWGC